MKTIETVNIKGVTVPLHVRQLKQRLKEELQIATASRRLQLDEQVEIHLLERQLEEMKAKEVKQQPKVLGPSEKQLSLLNQANLTAKERRALHKRQSSDPTMSKMSPVDDNADIEAALQRDLNFDMTGLTYAQTLFTRPMTSSRSETSIPFRKAFLGEEDELRRKEEKRHLLKLEIEKRKRELDENLQLQMELKRLTESVSMNPLEYNQIRKRYQQHVGRRDPYYDYRSKYLLGACPQIPATGSPAMPAAYPSQINVASSARTSASRSYSASEYLAHKAHSPGHELDDTLLYNDLYSDIFLPPSQSQPHLYGRGRKMIAIDSYPEFSPIPTETEPSPDLTPAMPILDDVTKRSRTKLRNIGSRPLSDEIDKYIREDLLGYAEMDDLLNSDDNLLDHFADDSLSTIKSRSHFRNSNPPILLEHSNSVGRIQYPFPTKRILLMRDPKDRSNKGYGIGMKIVGGKQISGGPAGHVGAFVAAIYKGGVADQLHGELQEGDQILEWNGIPLTGKTYEEVHALISLLNDNGEIELVIRPKSTIKNTPVVPIVTSSVQSSETSSKKSNVSTVKVDHHAPKSEHSSYDNLDFLQQFGPIKHNNQAKSEPISDSNGNNQPTLIITEDKGIDPNELAAQLRGIQESEISTPTSTSVSNQEQITSAPKTEALRNQEVKKRENTQKITQVDPVTSTSLTTNVTQSEMSNSSPATNLDSGKAAASTTTTATTTTISASRQKNIEAEQAPIVHRSKDKEQDLGDIRLQLSFDDFDNTLNIHLIEARRLPCKDSNGLSDPFVKFMLYGLE